MEPSPVAETEVQVLTQAEGETFQAWFGSDGILRINARGRRQELADAIANLKQCERLVTAPTPCLLDVTLSQGASREAQAFYAGPEMNRTVSKQALLIDSIMGKTFGNLYLIFNKPVFPIRLFRDRTEALRWLKEP